jgi:vesicle-fusing ATPase
MRENGHLANDVSMTELAALTPNYTGAEIQGVIASACSFAFMTRVEIGKSMSLKTERQDAPLLVTKEYFIKALEEVKPAYGKQNATLQLFLENGFVHYSKQVDAIVSDISMLMQKLRVSPTTHNISCLLHGTTLFKKVLFYF